jgi:hypothetical protein
MQYSSPHTVHSLIKTNKIDQPLNFCSSILILERKAGVVRVIHQIQIERPQLLVSKVQNLMEKYKNIGHLWIPAGIATSIPNHATPASL